MPKAYAYENGHLNVFDDNPKAINRTVLMTRTAETLNRFLPGFDSTLATRGVVKNVEEWEEGKSRLFELLSKHPQWNPNTLAIESTISRDRSFNRDRIRNTLEVFMRQVRYSRKPQLTQEFCDDFRSQLFRLKFLNTPNISSGTVELYNKRVEAGTLHEILKHQKPVVGQKTTRYLRSVLIKAEINTESPELRSQFTRLCEHFSDASETFKFVMSIDPSAYLTMSNGNSWDSCHNLDGGCYRRGTLSYMNDESTVMTFIVPENWDEESEDRYLSTTPKYYRRVIMHDVDTKVTMQSRIYPGYDNNQFYDAYGNKVISLLAECYAAGGETVEFTPHDAPHQSIFRRYDFGHYPDFAYGNSPTHVVGDKMPTPMQRKVIGGTNYCLYCGSEFDTSDSSEEVFCESCDCGGGYRGECGICNDDMYGQVYMVPDYGRVCPSCYNDYIIRCRRCGATIHRADGRELNDETYCISCFVDLGGSRRD